MFETDLTESEKKIIDKYILNVKPKMYIESGVYACGTFLNVINLCYENGINCKCYGIDIFNEIKKEENNTHTDNQYNKNELVNALNKKGAKKFELITGKGTDISIKIVHPCIVFFDDNHRCDNVYFELKNIHSKLNEKDIVIVHNCSNNIWPDNMYYKQDGGAYLAVINVVKERLFDTIDKTERIKVLQKVIW